VPIEKWRNLGIKEYLVTGVEFDGNADKKVDHLCRHIGQLHLQLMQDIRDG
jgi:hypothetical protein